MALTSYLTQTRSLLQNPPGPSNLYTTADLTRYINLARGQLAGEHKCIRKLGTLALTLGTQAYDFADIDTGVSATTGIGGVFNVRQANVVVADGAAYVASRAWAYFMQYHLNQVVPPEGQPSTWSQYGQGETGSLYVAPIPDDAFTMNLDCVCVPIPLVDDTTVEAIPFPFTDAIQFLAAYWAFMSSQRQTDAQAMYQRYQEFANRARAMSNPEVLGYQYSEAVDVTTPNKLGQGGQQ